MSADQLVVLDPLNQLLDQLRGLRKKMTADERQRAAKLVASLVNDAVLGEDDE